MKRISRFIFTIIAFLISLLLFIPPAAVYADLPRLSVTPTSLSATVELGSTTTLNLTITNTDSNPSTIHLYTGYPSLAAPAMMAAPLSIPVPLPQQQEPIDPDLQAELRHGTTRFLVFLPTVLIWDKPFSSVIGKRVGSMCTKRLPATPNGVNAGCGRCLTPSAFATSHSGL